MGEIVDYGSWFPSSEPKEAVKIVDVVAGSNFRKSIMTLKEAAVRSYFGELVRTHLELAASNKRPAKETDFKVDLKFPATSGTSNTSELICVGRDR